MFLLRKCMRFEAQLHNGERLRAWDRYPVCVAFHGRRRQGEGQERQDGLGGVEAGGRLKDIKHFRGDVAPVEGVRDGGLAEGSLDSTQETIDKERNPSEVRDLEKGAAQMQKC